MMNPRTMVLGPRAQYILLAASVWISDFLRLSSFGLYEDDWTFIPRAIAMTPSELASWVWHWISSLHGHGRPLSDSLISILSHVGYRLAGLEGVYWIGYLLVALNALLFYHLLRRLGNARFAFMGGLAFALFPADTTQPYLTHSLGLHPSLTFFLLGAHAYLSGRQVLMYILAAGSLFCYETVYPLFLAVPLLSGPWERAKRKELLRHFIVVALLLALSTLLRLYAGESRVAGLELPDLLLTPLRHVVVGPITSGAMFLYRPVDVLASAEPAPLLAATLGALAFAFAMGTQPSSTMPPAPRPGRLAAIVRMQVMSLVAGDRPPTARPTVAATWSRLLILGVLLLLLAYPLTFTNRSFSIAGRASRVHFAAIAGGALLFAWLGEYLLGRASKQPVRVIAIWGLALLLGLMLAFGLHVQRDYIQAWKQQQSFWTFLLPLISDVGDGDVVLIEPYGLRGPVQIDANTWNLPVVLEQLYDFPEGWADPPRVYRLVPGWEDHILQVDGQLRLFNLTVTSSDSFYKTVSSDQVILIQIEDEEPTRVEDPLMIGGWHADLKPRSEGTLHDLPNGPAYHLLLGSD